MKIKKDRITVTFTAGEALSEGDVVYISGTNEVKKATESEDSKVIGVADHAANAGDPVDVVIYGVKEVVTDGPISPGDTVGPASIAGRIMRQLTLGTLGHKHLENQEASYTQNTQTGESTDSYTPARILGKALGSASGAGDTVKILVCLA